MIVKNKIRFRFAIRMILIAIIFIIIFHFIIQFYNNYKIHQIEVEEAQSQIQQVEKLINFELSFLEKTTEDLAYCDKAYEFIKGKNDNYINEITYESLLILEVDFIVFLNRNGNYYYSIILDEDQQIIHYYSSEHMNMISDLQIPENSNKRLSISGIVNMEEHPSLIVSKPILQKDLSGFTMGNLVVGKYYQDKEINAINSLINSEFSIIENPNSEKDFSIERVNKDKMVVNAVYQTLNDNNNFIFQLEILRSNNIIISRINQSFYLAILSISIFLSILIYYLFDKRILQRIVALSSEVSSVVDRDSCNDNIPLDDKDDEITLLKKEINNMLNTISIRNSELYNLAFNDDLTKLPNRTAFLQRLNTLICKKQEFFMLAIDLDSFRTINLTYSSSIGDKLLISVAKMLKPLVSYKYDICRMDDSFYIIIENNRTDVIDTSEQIVNTISKTNIDNINYNLHCSVGVVSYPQDGKTNDELLNNSIEAIREAKIRGGNCYVIYNGIKEKIERNNLISNELYTALDNNEFHVVYQPQVDLLTQEITGFESLIRWNNPRLGSVGPGEFIPIAERKGLIIDIGYYVLETMCYQSQEFYETKGFYPKMAINISPLHFNYGIIYDHIREVIKKTNINPQKIELEITENIFLEDFDQVKNELNKIKTLGVTIAIDDFGIGFSSLEYLKHLPLDYIKIPLQFVQGIGNELDEKIIRTICSLAKSLDIEIIAEGIETEEQYEFLKSLKCKYAQGYYFYKPMLFNDIKSL